MEPSQLLGAFALWTWTQSQRPQIRPTGRCTSSAFHHWIGRIVSFVSTGDSARPTSPVHCMQVKTQSPERALLASSHSTRLYIPRTRSRECQRASKLVRASLAYSCIASHFGNARPAEHIVHGQATHAEKGAAAFAAHANFVDVVLQIVLAGPPRLSRR